MRVLGKIGVQ